MFRHIGIVFLFLTCLPLAQAGTDYLSADRQALITKTLRFIPLPFRLLKSDCCLATRNPKSLYFILRKTRKGQRKRL